MTTLEDLNNTVYQIELTAIKMYRLMGKPIPKYLRATAKLIDNQNRSK